MKILKIKKLKLKLKGRYYYSHPKKPTSFISPEEVQKFCQQIPTGLTVATQTRYGPTTSGCPEEKVMGLSRAELVTL